MTSPNIIFLDIDGVVIPFGGFAIPNQTHPPTICSNVSIGLINKLAEELKAQIVIHSSWVTFSITILNIMLNKNYSQDYSPTKIVQEHLISQGLTAKFHPDPVDKDVSNRWERITKWLENHPEYKDSFQYIIIDDELLKDFLDPIWPFIHLVDSDLGFHFKNFQQIRDLSKWKL